MLRRRFNANLALFATFFGIGRSSPLKAKQPTATAPILLLDCRIAGSHYYFAPQVLAHIQQGDQLELFRQPKNPHDARAVEVHWQTLKLGYLPRRDNTVIANLLDQGSKLHAEVLAVDAPLREWEPVRLRVYLSS